MRQFSWNDAVTETGLSRYKLGKAAAHCGIVIAKSQRDRRNVALTLEELSRIREAAHELWPDAKAAKTARLTDAGNFAAILASRLSELERRVRALEARQHVPALPTVPREPRATPSYVRASLDAQTGDVFPLAARARGRWVAARIGPGGPSWHTVRDWPETRTWQSAADAVRDVRARGWPDFMRSASATADVAESRTE